MGIGIAKVAGWTARARSGSLRGKMGTGRGSSGVSRQMHKQGAGRGMTAARERVCLGAIARESNGRGKKGESKWWRGRMKSSSGRSRQGRKPTSRPWSKARRDSSSGQGTTTHPQLVISRTRASTTAVNTTSSSIPDSSTIALLLQIQPSSSITTSQPTTARRGIPAMEVSSKLSKVEQSTHKTAWRLRRLAPRPRCCRRQCSKTAWGLRRLAPRPRCCRRQCSKTAWGPRRRSYHRSRCSKAVATPTAVNRHRSLSQASKTLPLSQ